MKLAAALALTVTATAIAQTPFTDPANLRGERPTPITGRELPQDQGAPGLQQILRRLSTRASLMLIVAHPDDEDGGMLTFYSRGLGARVAVLTLNRGEGGQNAMTGDFEDALGLLRTQELLSADRYFGVDQLFGTEVDFGFSKTKSEAFTKWGHDRVLYDAVRAIRLYRPLVLASVFIGGVTDGHGQHQVSGQICQEAFRAAGDPTIFPELTVEGILPWQPLKVYARVPQQAVSVQGLYDYATGQYIPPSFTNYVTGEVSNTIPSTDVLIPEGNQDPLFGPSTTVNSFVSYVQFARQGLGLQRSQIGGNQRIPPPGPYDVAYHRYGACPENCHPEHREGPAVRQTHPNSVISTEAERPAVSDSASPRKPLGPHTESSFFDNIDTSLKAIATGNGADPAFLLTGLARITASIDSATQHLDPNNLPAIAPQLAQALQDTTALITQLENSTYPAGPRYEALHDLRIKQTQLNQALALSLGLTLDATATGANQVIGTPIEVFTRLKTQSPTPLQVEKVFLSTAQGEIPSKASAKELAAKELPDLTPDRPAQRALIATPAYTGTITRPYFFRDNTEQAVYQLKQPDLRGAAQTPPALTATAYVTYKGVRIELTRVVHDKIQPVNFVPAATVVFSNRTGILPLNLKDPLVWVESTAPIGKCTAFNTDTPGCQHYTDQSINKLKLPANWKLQNESPVLAPDGQLLKIYDSFALTPPPLRSGDTFTTTATSTYSGHEYHEGYRPVGYPGLVATNYFTPATYRAVAADLNYIPSMFVGYIEGTGDETFDSLYPVFGGHVQRIEISEITPANLARYKAVILGVRTYAAHPDLHGAPTRALLDYARNGGNVVVQFQTPEFTEADAPYPLTLGNAEKVVDETAPVTLLNPSNPLLTTPNPISSADFDNWVEERGHGFLRSWDDRYTALTETHDPGAPEEHIAPQSPQRGGLITTRFGKGRWTYCAFALYRQLPEAVPGAYRLFLNLLNP